MLQTLVAHICTYMYISGGRVSSFLCAYITFFISEKFFLFLRNNLSTHFLVSILLPSISLLFCTTEKVCLMKCLNKVFGSFWEKKTCFLGSEHYYIRQKNLLGSGSFGRNLQKWCSKQMHGDFCYIQNTPQVWDIVVTKHTKRGKWSEILSVLWNTLIWILLPYTQEQSQIWIRNEFILIFKRMRYMSKVGKNLPRLRVMYSCQPKFTSLPPTYRLTTFHKSKFSSNLSVKPHTKWN